MELYKVFAVAENPSGFRSGWLWRRTRDRAIGYTLSPHDHRYRKHYPTVQGAVVFGEALAAFKAALRPRRRGPR